MCLGGGTTVAAPPPPPPPPPPQAVEIPEPPELADQGEGAVQKTKKKGRSSLRIKRQTDVNVAGASGTGVNVPE